MTVGGDVLQETTAEAAGLDPIRWKRVLELCEGLTHSHLLPALSLSVVKENWIVGPLAFGHRQLSVESAPLEPTDRFVVASLTKPVVAMGIMALVEQGKLALNDRVSEHVPEYRDAPKRPTTIRHLLTHTSGLPDALPENLALRKAHSPLSEFVNGTCEIGLDFPPGRGVQYQSLGYALLGTIIDRTAGMPFGQFLKQTFFDPLDMDSTTLGHVAPRIDRPVVEIRVPPEMSGGNDWNWNSTYWQQLGAPWGGMISTARDLARFCAMMLGEGELDGVRVLSPASVRAATINQIEAFHDVPESDRRTRPWGFGWRLNWTAHAACFGDLLPQAAYGHWGATGTLFWIDPTTRTAAVLLSSQPMEKDRSPLGRLSNAIAAAVGDR